VWERFSPYQNKLDDLSALQFRFMTVFGKEHQNLFAELLKLTNEIYFAASEIARIELGEYGY
jgi:hypothetical protein